MALATVGLKSHIWNNNFRSILLLIAYPLLLLVIAWALAAALGASSPRAAGMMYQVGSSTQNIGDPIGYANAVIFTYWPIIIAVCGIWFTIAWFFHSAMIRRLSRSMPVTRQQESELYNMLENLCISRGMAMPRLEIIETHARNAFASGLTEKSFAVTVTRGLMNSLAEDELEAVIAHELTHIQNRDVRLLIVTVIFTGLFGFLAQLAWSNIRYNVFYTAGRRSKNGNGAIVVVIVIAVILWLGYMASLIMRFALSRRREYMADAGAIEMTKNPDAMMRALMRIAGRDRIPETTDDIAMMCIENRKAFLGVFSTHPPIDKRIKAISRVTGTPIPDTASLPPVHPRERLGGEKAGHYNPWLIRGRRP